MSSCATYFTYISTFNIKSKHPFKVYIIIPLGTQGLLTSEIWSDSNKWQSGQCDKWLLIEQLWCKIIK